MWKAYEKIIQRIIPKFKVYICLKNIQTSLKMVCSKPDLLELSVSCIGRANLRKHWHDWVANKFGIVLPTHRCGRCYKCCVEYIYMADNGLIEYSESYYKYCINNLKKNIIKEGDEVFDIEDVWSRYFFYDISKSHALNFI